MSYRVNYSNGSVSGATTSKENVKREHDNAKQHRHLDGARIEKQNEQGKWVPVKDGKL